MLFVFQSLLQTVSVSIFNWSDPSQETWPLIIWWIRQHGRYPAGMERQLQNIVIFTKVGQQNKRTVHIKSTFTVFYLFKKKKSQFSIKGWKADGISTISFHYHCTREYEYFKTRLLAKFKPNMLINHKWNNSFEMGINYYNNIRH